jgi:hypothetical protein
MSFAPAYTSTNGPHRWPAVPCPHCGKPTDSLKRYRVFRVLLFLFVGYYLETVMHMACPRCMRRSLALRTLVNLPTANLLWPVVVVFHGILLLRSYTNGHSRSIIRILRGER